MSTRWEYAPQIATGWIGRLRAEYCGNGSADPDNDWLVVSLESPAGEGWLVNASILVMYADVRVRTPGTRDVAGREYPPRVLRLERLRNQLMDACHMKREDLDIEELGRFLIMCWSDVLNTRGAA